MRGIMFSFRACVSGRSKRRRVRGVGQGPYYYYGTQERWDQSIRAGRDILLDMTFKARTKSSKLTRSRVDLSVCAVVDGTEGRLAAREQTGKKLFAAGSPTPR